MTETRLGVAVTVRFFAAASAAAGVAEEVLTAPLGTTVGDLVTTLSDRNPELARVLQRCSYLRDGFAVRDLNVALISGQTLDVLPPFSGG